MRKRLKLIITLGVVIICLCCLVVFAQSKYVAPILMYHSINYQVNPGSEKLVVSPAVFERQMRFLKTNRYNVISLEALAGLIRDKKRIPPRTVALTFDDGYKDNYAYAFGVLRKYNFPATIFIIINEVGRPENDRLSWDEIKDMTDSGIIDFGSHTLGPKPLIDIKNEEELKKQVFVSRKILEEKLGRQVNIFSYPEGRFNDRIRQLVIDAGYKVAVTGNAGRKYPDSDVFALKRLRISSNAANLFVFWVESSGFYNLIREYRHK